MVDNDGSQMAEIVAFVDSYGWREVVTVYIDYGYEINTISALGNALTTYKYSDSGLCLFQAQDIGMLSTSYVWMAMDWLSFVLDSVPLESDSEVTVRVN